MQIQQYRSFAYDRVIKVNGQAVSPELLADEISIGEAAVEKKVRQASKKREAVAFAKFWNSTEGAQQQ